MESERWIFFRGWEILHEFGWINCRGSLDGILIFCRVPSLGVLLLDIYLRV